MITLNLEYELNRGWIYDEDGEEIGEINFVVPAGWLADLYNKHFANVYGDINSLLEMYEPEEEGEFIYQKAIEDNVLIEDLGTVYY